VNELKELVVTYARQETVDPFKTLGRYLGFGAGGALLIGAGWIFALLALLRGLQTIDIFNDPAETTGGRWSWVPFALTAVAGIVVAALYGRLVAVRMGENGVQGGDQR
jgi:hypothetical protein